MTMPARLSLHLALFVVGLTACGSDPPTRTTPTGVDMAPSGVPGSARPLATMTPAPSGAPTVATTAPGNALDPLVGCLTDTDCGWGEIGREIEQSSDCMCLLGCPDLALNVPTLKRRASQYKSLCKPGFAGGGQPCPIDDCAPPPKITCRDHVCQAR
ncbi:MAG: hypothetical protein U0414_03975 [Polyangiaceae bacterium]